MRVARDDAERALLWKGRKEAAGAVGRITHNYVLQDAVVPRSKLPTVMAQIQAIAARHGLVVANVFHAGDGNLHPMICYDERVPGEFARALEANEEILHACIALGGTVTGEHGVGLDKAEKLALLFNPDDLEVMHAVRRVFDPRGLMNPQKVFPSGTARLRPGLGRRGQARAGGHVGLAAADVGRELAAAVAPGTVLSGDRASARTVAGVAPRFVAEPTTVDGVSRVLALASAHGLAVAPIGGGARLAWGTPPRRLDVVLSLARLDRILAHEPADLTLSVECGATLEALDAVLRPHRQFVPLDPARPGSSTVGGLIATGRGRTLPGAVRDDARPPARPDRGPSGRHRRQGRRARGQERHRLRHPEAPRGRARHARRRRGGAPPAPPPAGRGAELGVRLRERRGRARGRARRPRHAGRAEPLPARDRRRPPRAGGGRAARPPPWP